MLRVLIIHGLGMNMRGKVKQETFGHQTLEQYDLKIAEDAVKLGVDVEFFQSNIEGEVINKLYDAHERRVDGALLNPGGFARGYPGLAAAIDQVWFPVIEVHVSNPAARGVISDVARVTAGSITGFGVSSYRLGLIGLRDLLSDGATRTTTQRLRPAT